eukprot:TRINITY_DN1027_c0_g1_i2.p1 TRINITY_DN1027_c0_g1~~TRINITY_DN1027_c0_g1_i2.p1  ORF type:complete len:102 (+),score=7.41 TRINITY_DN1027_c0_g1_i2:28-333(+)
MNAAAAMRLVRLAGYQARWIHQLSNNTPGRRTEAREKNAGKQPSTSHWNQKDIESVNIAVEYCETSACWTFSALRFGKQRPCIARSGLLHAARTPVICNQA